MVIVDSSLSSSDVGRATLTPRSRCGTHGPVMWLSGEHDCSTVAALSALFAEAIATDDDDLVVDLSGVTFMGADTVGVLVRARQFLGQSGRSLLLRAPSVRAQRVLDLCDIASGASEGVDPAVDCRTLARSRPDRVRPTKQISGRVAIPSAMSPRSRSRLGKHVTTHVCRRVA